MNVVFEELLVLARVAGGGCLRRADLRQLLDAIAATGDFFDQIPAAASTPARESMTSNSNISKNRQQRGASAHFCTRDSVSTRSSCGRSESPTDASLANGFAGDEENDCSTMSRLWDTTPRHMSQRCLRSFDIFSWRKGGRW